LEKKALKLILPWRTKTAGVDYRKAPTLMFQLLVLWRAADLEITDPVTELERRHKYNVRAPIPVPAAV
jgi:phosphoribosyl-ATP pyrophosphohydrolase